ncbi:cupin domain-containing protein [Kitasatospora purpeofusca]|uniref:cupin domain-containing protein n=1 Tax=Kitasatospora purpeofusca TaxID=67352 RepID=UPI0022575A2B|nr:cupin domain-containing protein [Kitasatospora purpeofusca]MCX4759337.1 AraC family transcriptional regulator [Kitasatospora purpeofusca]WSR30270.1 AraC family transcriptional regulator [Kitasatospora purpeofusca]
MDVVSDAIAAVRIGRPSSNRLRVGGAWSARIPAYEGAGFHVVLEGGCWLLPDGGEPVRLGAGDAVLLPHGTGHVLASAPLDRGAAAAAVPIDRLLAAARRTPPPGAEGPLDGAPAPEGPLDGAPAPEGPLDGAPAPEGPLDGAPAPEGPLDGAPGPLPVLGAAGGPIAELLCGKYRLEHSRSHPLMLELPDVVHLPNRVGAHPQLRAAVDLLGGELASDGAGGALAVPSLIDLLLVYMLRAWLSSPRPSVGAGADTGAGADADAPPGSGAALGTGGRWPAALGDRVVAGALRALHEDPARGWSVEELAASAGVSRATLTRRFTALVGRAPMAYLAWWRMTRAAALLQQSADPLDVIARRVGYATPYALSHAFSRQFGTTPGRYRDRMAAHFADG